MGEIESTAAFYESAVVSANILDLSSY